MTPSVVSFVIVTHNFGDGLPKGQRILMARDGSGLSGFSAMGDQNISCKALPASGRLLHEENGSRRTGLSGANRAILWRFSPKPVFHERFLLAFSPEAVKTD